MIVQWFDTCNSLPPTQTLTQRPDQHRAKKTLSILPISFTHSQTRVHTHRRTKTRKKNHGVFLGKPLVHLYTHRHQSTMLFNGNSLQWVLNAMRERERAGNGTAMHMRSLVSKDSCETHDVGAHSPCINNMVLSLSQKLYYSLTKEYVYPLMTRSTPTPSLSPPLSLSPCWLNKGRLHHFSMSSGVTLSIIIHRAA